MVHHDEIERLFHWLVGGAQPECSAPPIIDRICRTLRDAGVPVDRMALFIYSLSTTGTGRRYSWSPHAEVEMAEGPVDLFVSRTYLDNPLPRVVEERRAIRRRLGDPACPIDYPVLAELRDDGFTDYLVQPLVYLTGGTNVVSWSSKAPGGFDEAAVSAQNLLNGPIARLTEALVLHLNATAVMSAYVGRNGGEQVLSGKIHRGDGEEIEAAILFADLIGFTEISDRLTGPQTVSMLNDTFDVMVPSVENHGGEILKFMGDGFLAIFPYAGLGGEGQAVRSAKAAFVDGETALANAEAGKTATFRSALHAGRFHYGNIGGASRLDFTAIGRPVNYAARLLSAASDLSLVRVASAQAASFLDGETRVVGEVPFKGFEGLHTICAY